MPSNGHMIFMIYGINGSVSARKSTTSISANNGTFGDPAPGTPKYGYYICI